MDLPAVLICDLRHISRGCERPVFSEPEHAQRELHGSNDGVVHFIRSETGLLITIIRFEGTALYVRIE